MIACDQTITLVHHIKGENDIYKCHTVNRASWFAKTTITTSGDGAKPANSYDVRVFDPLDGHIPELGDYCVKGTVSGITKPADLKGKDCFRITAIGFNRRGGLAHWRVSGQ